MKIYRLVLDHKYSYFNNVWLKGFFSIIGKSDVVKIADLNEKYKNNYYCK